MKLRLTSSICLFFLFALPAASQQKSTYSVDGTASKIEISVFKEGVLKAFAHDHSIAPKHMSGQVQFVPAYMERSSVFLKINAESLTVLDPGISDRDRQEIQTTMLGDKVLDTAKFPEITFASTNVPAVQSSGNGWQLMLQGNLSLHGVQKTINFPLSVRTEANELNAEGEVWLLQTDYGITPVKVAGGGVKVKNKIRIDVSIVARLDGSP
jgi:polyisoprenoid-binding protein YceI